MEGGDELLNTEIWPHCGSVIYLEQEIEWVDEERTKSPNVQVVAERLRLMDKQGQK